MKFYVLVMIVSGLFSAAAVEGRPIESDYVGVRVLDNFGNTDDGYYGDGCELGTTEIKFEDKGSTLAIEFSEYAVNSPRNGGSNSINCNISVDLDIPQGHQVRVKDLIYNGHMLVSPGGSAEFDVNYFFNDIQMNSNTNKTVENDTNRTIRDYFVLSSEDDVESILWSKCVTNPVLRIDMKASVESGLNNGRTKLKLDSVDLALNSEMGMLYAGLDIRSCKAFPGRQPCGILGPCEPCIQHGYCQVPVHELEPKSRYTR